MQVSVGSLTGGQRRSLERLRRRAVGRVSQRAHMVLLSGRGFTVQEIARVFDCGEEVVRQWLHRYRERGEGGLEDAPRPGRPPKDRLAAHIIDAQMGQPPPRSGHVQTGWTAGLLAAFLARRFRLRAVAQPGAALPARHGLAVGPPAPGSGHPRAARPAQGRSGGGPEAGPARPGAGRRRHRPLSGRVRAAAPAGGAGDVDEGPPGAGADPGHERPAGHLRRPGRPHRRPAPRRAPQEAGGALRRLPGAPGRGLPHRRGGPGPGQREHPRRQGGAALAGPARARPHPAARGCPSTAPTSTTPSSGCGACSRTRWPPIAWRAASTPSRARPSVSSPRASFTAPQPLPAVLPSVA